MEPATVGVRKVASKVLAYTRLRHLATRAEREARGKNIEFTEIVCFRLHDGPDGTQLITNAGYAQRLEKALAEVGYPVVHRNMRKTRREYKPDLTRLEGTVWRHKQRSTLQAVLDNEYGRIHWATGTGKTWLIPLICLAYPKARIVVTTKFQATLETIYNRLVARLPNVGIYTSKQKRTGRRVMCYTAGSLHHALELDPHFIIADEVHELATDHMFEKLARFRQARMFSLSANDGDRFDQADFELEGIFGPIISSLDYAEAQKHGMVVPIHVYWRDVFMEYDPAEGKEGVPGLRSGIWRNKYRNKLIAEDAKGFADDQVLITCRTLEHACFLKKYLPEFELCYAPNETHGSKLDMYKTWNLLPDNTRQITARKLQWMRKRFEEGRLKKVIATTVWNRGVSFDELQVLIRADASSSTIDDTQIPGRLARTSVGKDHGLLIDYRDQFSDAFRKKADKRRRDYGKKKWKQFLPALDEDEGISLLRAMTLRRSM